MARRKNEEREDRIIMEIVVDAYGPEERAVGWHAYLESTLSFPFAARCTGQRAISPLSQGDEVEVIDMAPFDECMREMFVMIRWGRKEGLAVPLAQLKPGKNADPATRQAVEDWRYWVQQGYCF